MTCTLPLLLPCVAAQPLCSVLSPLKPSKDIQYSKNFAFQLLLSQDALRDFTGDSLIFGRFALMLRIELRGGACTY